jgi:hypothetical protein
MRQLGFDTAIRMACDPVHRGVDKELRPKRRSQLDPVVGAPEAEYVLG